MIERSETTSKLEAALCKAQASFRAASKDRENPHFKSKYADLASIWEACRSSLTENSICVMQWLVHGEDTRLHIVTRLSHEGEWMQAHWSLPVSKPDAQGYGSAASYARRYALAAALGVVADEDGDGNAASEKPSTRSASRPRGAQAPAGVSGSNPQAGTSGPPVTGQGANPSPRGPVTGASSSDEEWKTRIQLAGSVSVEELDSLQPEIERVEDEMLRGRLRRYQAEIRKRAVARAEAKRIAKGEPPAGGVSDDGGPAA